MLNLNNAITTIPVTFSPSYYKMAKNAFDKGNYKYLLALIDRAEEDSYISGCLIARHAGYKRRYIISPASDATADQRAAEILETAFSRLNMRELLEDIMDARMKWYSVLAVDWEVTNNLMLPVSIDKKEQKYFVYDKNRELKLDFGKEQKKIPAGAAIVIQSKRKPIMLNVLKDYIRKEMGESNWSSFLEVFGEPFIIGKYPAGASADYKTELESGINKMGQSTRGIVPSTADIQIIETKRTTGDHRDYLQDCKEGISMALLGHKDAAGSDKSMQIGDNTAGIQVKKDIAIDDMFWLEEKLKAVIKEIITRNINVSEMPKVTLDKSDNVDLKTKLIAAELGLNNGAQIDSSFLLEFGVPVSNPEEPLKNSSLINLGV